MPALICSASPARCVPAESICWGCIFCRRTPIPSAPNAGPIAEGRTHVTTTLRVLSSSRRTRLEQIRISLLVRERGKIARYRDEFPLRIYTAAQLRSLLASVPEWELAAVYDYWYELDNPLRLTNELSDTALVLKRL